VQYLWNLLTNHHMSEHRVLMVQLILGLCSCVLVFATLRFLVRPNIALVLALVFTAIPHVVLMERAILTESIELALVTFGTFTAVVTMKVRKQWAQAVLLSLAAVTYGLAVSVHAASLLALGIPLVVASLALTIRGHWKIRASWKSWTGRLAMMAVLPVLFLAPSIPVFNLHERVYGVSSFSPIANATLVYRWSPIISCKRDPRTTQLTRAIVRKACRNREFFPVPGMNLAPIFDKQTGNLLFRYNNQFARSSKEFGALAMRAIADHPWIVAREMSRSIIWQVVRERHFAQFEPAVAFVQTAAPRDKLYPNWRRWFGSHNPTSNSPFPRSLLRTTDENIMLPNHLLWIGLTAVGGRLLLGFGTRRRSLSRWRIASFSHVELAVLVVALSQIMGLAIAVAYSSAPDPRYWIPFIPTMFVLIALGVVEVLPNSPGGSGEPEILDF